jgi:hypothetical protein
MNQGSCEDFAQLIIDATAENWLRASCMHEIVLCSGEKRARRSEAVSTKATLSQSQSEIMCVMMRFRKIWLTFRIEVLSA